MSKTPAAKAAERSPDAHLAELIEQAKNITESWAKRHDLWHDSWHKDPIQHYDDEVGEGGPILVLCSEGPAMTSLEWDDGFAAELRNELNSIGVYMEMEDRVTADYHLIDYQSALQKEFDRYFQWKWNCRLIEADSEEVSGSLYQHFAENPDDLKRLPHREFEKLISSIFAANGWKTELGPGSNDGGVDLRLWQSDPLGDMLTLVQIKRYASHLPIKLEAVAALDSHVSTQGANRGLFVTSSRYQPNVKAFAERKKHTLTLADSTDIARWCEQATQASRTSQNRAMAMETFGKLSEQIRIAGKHPRLVTGGKYDRSFCIVLKETKTAALLVHIPSDRISGDALRGHVVPRLDGTTLDQMPDGPVFRATRSDKDGQISYWGQRNLYHCWDGKPCAYDHWD